MVCNNTRKNRHFSKTIRKYSTPKIAQRMAYKYLGKTAKLYPANNPHKKYKICELVMKTLPNTMIKKEDYRI